MSDRKSSEPSLSALSFALRHPEMWPRRFWWSYTSCETCAIGLATQMWPQHVPPLPQSILGPGVYVARSMFGLSEAEAEHIFIHAGVQTRTSCRDVKPEQVADLIDELVAVQ